MSIKPQFHTPPSFLPPGWKRRSANYYTGPQGLAVQCSESIERDYNLWLHISLAHKRRLPTYSELKEAKLIFIGEDKLAIQVFPPRNEFVSFHPFCLHLWHCKTASPIPDFRKFGMI